MDHRFSPNSATGAGVAADRVVIRNMRAERVTAKAELERRQLGCRISARRFSAGSIVASHIWISRLSLRFLMFGNN